MEEAKALAELYYNELKWWASDKQGIILRTERSFNAMLQKGITPLQIKEAICAYKKSHPTEEDLRGLIIADQIFKVDTKKQDKGLLEEGVFYFHPRLQKAPAPPVITITNDGEFVSSYESEPFFLEIVDSFTMDDLLNYFYEKTGQKDKNPKRDVAGFEYILKNAYIEPPLNTLDLILFTIDNAVATCLDEDKKCPTRSVQLLDYIDDGLVLYQEKYNYCKLEGLDHVIPRR